MNSIKETGPKIEEDMPLNYDQLYKVREMASDTSNALFVMEEGVLPRSIECSHTSMTAHLGLDSIRHPITKSLFVFIKHKEIYGIVSSMEWLLKRWGVRIKGSDYLRFELLRWWLGVHFLASFDSFFIKGVTFFPNEGIPVVLDPTRLTLWAHARLCNKCTGVEHTTRANPRLTPKNQHPVVQRRGYLMVIFYY